MRRQEFQLALATRQVQGVIPDGIAAGDTSAHSATACPGGLTAGDACASGVTGTVIPKGIAAGDTSATCTAVQGSYPDGTAADDIRAPSATSCPMGNAAGDISATSATGTGFTKENAAGDTSATCATAQGLYPGGIAAGDTKRQIRS